LELRKTAEILKEAQKVARLGHWEWNPQTNEVLWSDEIFRILGYDQKTTTADFDLWFDMIHPSDLHSANKFVEDTLKGKQVLSTEYRIVRQDGEIRHLLVKGTTTFDERNQPSRILGVMQDITERAQAEQENEQLLEAVTQQREELRALNTRAAEADEIERQRIAKELHDQIGQNMSALSINLNILQNRVSETDANLIKKIDDSLNLVDETTDGIRNVMADLHPTVLDDYGLLPALNWLAERVGERTGLRIDVTSKNLKEERLNPKVEMQLFRITQESLNNISRHARAKRVTIALKQLEHFLQLSIADDGIGFDVDHQQKSGENGWGLRIMRERAEAIGGRFRVESAPRGPGQAGEAGRGSKVIVELDN
jgi:two-component system sensor histidine kinase UhpB